MPEQPTANPKQFIQGAPVLHVPDVEATARYYRDVLGFNWDFGDDSLITTVFELAAVNFWNGWRTWDTFHYDEGEFSSLIYGWTTVYDDHEDCWPL